MTKQLNYYISQLEFHRYNPDGFLFKLAKDFNFDIGTYEHLLNLIIEIKEKYKGKNNISRVIASILYEINSLYQSILQDVFMKKYSYNITDMELWERWECLNYEIGYFFDDVNRSYCSN